MQSDAMAQSTRTAVNDPCPQIMEAARSAPGDLAQVQADIERYTLCVQRAVLLQRLNELAAKNSQDITPVFSLDNIEGLPYSRAEIEQMVSNLQAREEEVNQLIASRGEGESNAQEPSDTQEAPTGPNYRIDELFGSGGQMEARLIDSNGTPYRVGVGDALPDGSTVVAVSAAEVAIVKDEQRKTLYWAQPSGGF